MSYYSLPSIYNAYSKDIRKLRQKSENERHPSCRINIIVFSLNKIGRKRPDKGKVKEKDLTQLVVEAN